MHPPLDRPHPDCQDVIQELRDCHANSSWKKYLGECNDVKYRLDRCLKAEKQRVLDELNRDLDDRKKRQEEIIKVAFGKDVTFSEYLQQDKEYQHEVKRKEAQQEQRPL
jgi:COX assembly mitochondrial protein 2